MAPADQLEGIRSPTTFITDADIAARSSLDSWGISQARECPNGSREFQVSSSSMLRLWRCEMNVTRIT